MRPTYNGKPDNLYFVLCGTVATALLVAAVIGGSLRLAERLKPRTGDILSFNRAKGVVSDRESMVTVGVVGNSSVVSCVLKPHVMQTSGGSLVIVAVQYIPSLHYQAHWAGTRTSDEGTDCGRSADLLLSPDDLSALSFAAGGWG
jgi:hypothetical protein